MFLIYIFLTDQMLNNLLENENLLPEFIYKEKVGEIANNSSIIRTNNKEALVSVNNTLYIWSLRTNSIKQKITDEKNIKITNFIEYNFENSLLYILGYENGIIKIFNDENELITQFRPHSKRITGIIQIENQIIVSSADGTVIRYDVLSEEVKMWYKGNAQMIYNMKFFDDKIYANCGDNAVRIWDVNNENLEKLISFSDEIFDFEVYTGFLVIFYMSGESEIYNIEEKSTKKFSVFKRLNALKRKNEFLFLLVKSKFYRFKVTFDKEDLKIQNIDSQKVDDTFMDFDIFGEKFVFITKENSIEIQDFGKNSKSSIVFHKKSIFDFIIEKKKIVTCSEDKFIVWRIEKEGIEKLYSHSFNFAAHSIGIYERNIVVGCSDGFFMYDFDNCSLKYAKEISNSLIKIHKNKLCLVHENTMNVFRVNTKEKIETVRIYENTFDDHITYINISDDGKYMGLSFLNNTVNIYDFNNFDQKLVLYGHSLPVRHFVFSPDSKTILTCGSDKLVKLWGTDFGECRKSFIGNSTNAQYLNNEAFIYCDKNIKYIKKHDLIKEYKIQDLVALKYENKSLFCILKNGFAFFETGKYELVVGKDDEDVEEEILRENKIVNARKYEKFMEELEKLAEGTCERNDDFFTILNQIDLAEVNQYIYFLTSEHVKIMIEYLDDYVEKAPLLTGRYLNAIFRIHAYMCQNDQKTHETFKKAMKNLYHVKESIGINLATFNFL